uniref:Uncharacterized protein n=1 Tax=Glossina austeni TaxID=7395 RepID=A0A1A9VWI7_GLOAU
MKKLGNDHCKCGLHRDIQIIKSNLSRPLRSTWTMTLRRQLFRSVKIILIFLNVHRAIISQLANLSFCRALALAVNYLTPSIHLLFFSEPANRIKMLTMRSLNMLLVDIKLCLTHHK